MILSLYFYYQLLTVQQVLFKYVKYEDILTANITLTRMNIQYGK